MTIIIKDRAGLVTIVSIFKRISGSVSRLSVIELFYSSPNIWNLVKAGRGIIIFFFLELETKFLCCFCLS